MVIIVGAGVSLSATFPSPPRITWTGLISNGLEYLEDEAGIPSDDRELDFYRSSLQQESPKLRQILRACNYLREELVQHNKFATWLRDVFEKLHEDVKQPQILRTIGRAHSAGARILTTNYDELLEEECQFQRIRRSIPEDVIKYGQGTLSGIFHIHGSYQDPDDVVLDAIDYYKIRASDNVQELLKYYLAHNTVLFVGCGSGLEDPNFEALLAWASQRAGNVAHHHFLLARTGENLRYDPLITLKYGQDYDNLEPYLRDLLGLQDLPTEEVETVSKEPEGTYWPVPNRSPTCNPSSWHEEVRYRKLTQPRSSYIHADSVVLEQRALDIVKALNSLDLSDAELEINIPVENTCNWVFDIPQFVDWWSDDSRVRLLCVHGRIGAGKSTLVKRITTWIKDAAKPVISYFVKPPKDPLGGCSPAAIYQALLCQFLYLPSIRGHFLEVFDTRLPAMLVVTGIDDLQHELCMGLQQALRKITDEWVTIVIDGIDHCTDPQEILHFFRDAVSSSSTSVRICYTRRQTVAVPNPAYTYVAIEDYNYQDIRTFIQSRLPLTNITSKLDRDFLQTIIEENSSGVFLWVVLAVNLVEEHLSKGRDVAFLQRLLQDLPKELSKLYEDILARAIRANSTAETCTMVHILQWILFSARPLTAAEWHHVIAFIETPYLQSIREWKDSPSYTQSNEILLQRIRSLCCGLVEVKAKYTPYEQFCIQSEIGSLGAGAGSFESQQYLDVIHGSVYDYLINYNGFGMLDRQILNPIGAGHAHLLEVCARYFNLEEMLKAFKPPRVSFKPCRPQTLNRRHSEESVVSPSRDNVDVHRVPSLYIRRNRSDDAITLGGSAGGSIRSGHSGRRIFGSRTLRLSESLEYNLPDGHIEPSGSNDDNVSRPSWRQKIWSFISAIESTEDYPRADEGEYANRMPTLLSRYSTLEVETLVDPPILWQYCQDMLVHHAIATERAGLFPEPVVDFLFNTWNALRQKLHQGASLIYFAAQWNLASWIRHLEQANADDHGGELGYPVIVAASNDSLSAFKQLIGDRPLALDRKLSLRFRDTHGRTAMHHAARVPDSQILSYIYEQYRLFGDYRPSAVNNIDKNRLTPLHLAALQGSAQNVTHLIELGASVRALDLSGNNPLHLACVRQELDHEIVRILILAGCKRDVPNSSGKTAVDLAREGDDPEVMTLLETLVSPTEEQRTMAVTRRMRLCDDRQRGKASSSLANVLRQHIRFFGRDTEDRLPEERDPLLSSDLSDQLQGRALRSHGSSKRNGIFCCCSTRSSRRDR